MLTELAPAKINLFLHVTGRRPDGYHLLDSLVVFAGAHDRLRVEPSDRLSLTLGGPFAVGLQAEADNLVLRAARALAAYSKVVPRAAIHLEKFLPVASGIGGGSADAAAALRALARLWGIDVPAAALHGLAAGLGADVPVCLASRPCRMGGIGDVLGAAFAIPPCGLLLVNPGAALATPAVFSARTGAFSALAQLPTGWADAAGMAADLACLTNDLEQAAAALCPPVGRLLEELRGTPGCLLARMSGSGATCFALFATAPEAAEAAGALARQGRWCHGGALWPSSTPLYEAGPRT